MMKAHICYGCGKLLANRHTLSRHKKICKGGDGGGGDGGDGVARSGVLHASDTPIHALVDDSNVEGVNDMVSDSTYMENIDMCHYSSVGNVEDGTAGSDGGGGGDGDGCSNNFDLWEKFVDHGITMKTRNIFDTLNYFLSPYYLLPGDDVFKVIVHDITEALQNQNMNYSDAVDSALEKNKQNLQTSIDNAAQDGNVSISDVSIWRTSALKEHNQEECCCGGGSCMISHLKYLLVMFHHMDMDDVIQDIMESIRWLVLEDDGEVAEERLPLMILWMTTHIACENYARVILDKVDDVAMFTGKHRW